MNKLKSILTTLTTKLRAYEIPKPIAWFAGALLYMALLRVVDVSIAAAFAMADCEIYPAMVGAGSVGGLLLGFFLFMFTIGRSQRAHIKSQQALLDKTLVLWNQLLLQRGEEACQDKPKRIEGDEWKDG